MLPGGFSYGDYLRCGAMAAHSPIMREVKARADKGVAVLGICNGFQILTEAGLLPGVLMRNAGLKFVCRNVGLKVETSQSLFTRQYEKGQVLCVPGRAWRRQLLRRRRHARPLEGERQVAFRYCSPTAVATSTIPTARRATSPASSTKECAGPDAASGERVEPLHGSTDGKALFKSLVEALS